MEGIMAQDDESRPEYERATTLAQLGGFVPPFNAVQLISLYDRQDATLKSFSIRTDVVVTDDFSDGSGDLGATECLEHEAIDVAGQSRTGEDGSMTWRLTDVICAASGRTIREPASFVATPITTGPIYLTTKIVIPDPPDDLVVSVFTWDSSGTAAPGIAFSWRCRVRYKEAIG